MSDIPEELVNSLFESSEEEMEVEDDEIPAHVIASLFDDIPTIGEEEEEDELPEEVHENVFSVAPQPPTTNDDVDLNVEFEKLKVRFKFVEAEESHFDPEIADILRSPELRYCHFDNDGEFCDVDVNNIENGDEFHQLVLERRHTLPATSPVSRSIADDD